MAPEVRQFFLGAPIFYDYRADIWSLGAMAVAFLTGNMEPRVTTRPIEDIIEDLRSYGSSRSYALDAATVENNHDHASVQHDMDGNEGGMPPPSPHVPRRRHKIIPPSFLEAIAGALRINPDTRATLDEIQHLIRATYLAKL
jgi:serine/threonine protein kinase